MTAKTLAQWRREFPAYDTAIRAVEALRGTRLVPHTVAHIHPDTHTVSILLHGSRRNTETADRLLHDFGYPAGGWALEAGHDHEIWRKRVAR
uniref:hypothetical protein n=1 Tax=Paractinoplanes polyasparticus TaxID=2856853 RepID=UPI001C863AA6|nr:hypothetical protein [Actinoplanes polyasparticus]